MWKLWGCRGLDKRNFACRTKLSNWNKGYEKWLSSVLNHKYYDMLRRKYKLPTVSINLVAEDIPNFPDFREENDGRPSLIRYAVRSLICRENIVRWSSVIILKAKKYKVLRTNLGIPKERYCQGYPQAENRWRKDLILWSVTKSKVTDPNDLTSPATAVWGLTESRGH